MLSVITWGINYIQQLKSDGDYIAEITKYLNNINHMEYMWPIENWSLSYRMWLQYLILLQRPTQIHAERNITYASIT